MQKRTGLIVISLMLFLTISIFSPGVLAENIKNSPYYKQQALIDQATITFKSFVTDPNMSWFRSHLTSCKALLIVPQLLKGAFILGAEGGTGVLVARDKYTGKWSQPVFYNIASLSFGLQAGAQSAQIILMIMTDNGMNALLSTSIKLGADVSIAAGPYGTGAKAETVDVLAFSKTKGLFGGISIEGALISPKDSWNIAYYRKNVSPVDIIIRKMVSNPYSQRLISAIESAYAISNRGIRGQRPQTPEAKTTRQKAN